MAYDQKQGILDRRMKSIITRTHQNEETDSETKCVVRFLPFPVLFPLPTRVRYFARFRLFPIWCPGVTQETNYPSSFPILFPNSVSVCFLFCFLILRGKLLFPFPAVSRFVYQETASVSYL
jgi:hypothetical protein